MRRFILCVICCCFVLGSLCVVDKAEAGPWSPKLGKGYAKLWFRWLPSNNYAKGDFSRVPFHGYHEWNVVTYGEVGLSRGLALFWQSDLTRIYLLPEKGGKREGPFVGVGDPALGLKWQFLQRGPLALGVSGSVRAPLADSSPKGKIYSSEEGAPLLGELRMGMGAWAFQGAFSWGLGFRRWYLQGELGFEVRTAGQDPAFRWSVSSGVNLVWGISTSLRLSGHHAIPVGVEPRHDGPSGLGHGTSYTGMAFIIDWEFVDNWYLGTTIELSILFQGVARQAGGPVTTLYVATKF